MADKIQHDPKNISGNWAPQSWAHLKSLRETSPLIQCITNFVSADFVANVLISAGACPAMIHSIEETPDFSPKTHALYINVGTFTPDWIPAMKLAATAANESGRPWVLDPVAAGASGHRLRACLELLKMRPSVIRGNGSEIISLFKGSLDDNSKGVDSTHQSIDALEAAKALAKNNGSIVAISGAVDIITDGHRVVGAKNGVSMLQKITGTGCSVTALIAAFVAIDPSRPFEATASALSVFGVASEMGMNLANGPASLRMHLIDSLYGLDQTTLLQRVNIQSMWSRMLCLLMFSRILLTLELVYGTNFFSFDYIEIGKLTSRPPTDKRNKE